MTMFRYWLGGLLLAFALLIGGFGFYQSYPQWLGGERATALAVDESYLGECGDCHLAYHPRLLPSHSWQLLMDGLDDHFGDNAELDIESTEYIRQYLQRAASRPGHPDAMSKLLRNFPRQTPIQISALPYFEVAHQKIVKQAKAQSVALANCDECHQEAVRGLFRDPQPFEYTQPERR